MNFKEIKQLNPALLEPGMVLAEDLYINSIMLLSKDTLLTEKNIERITNLYFTTPIYVYSELQDYDLEILKNKNSKNYKEVESNFSRFSDASETIFQQINSNSKLDIKDIRNLSEEILDEMNDYGIIIKNIIDSRNPDSYLFRHSVNVAALSAMLGKWLHMSDRDVMLLTYAGILHDIGKSKIPLSILNKAGKLTSKEFEIVKSHTLKGYEIVKTIPFIDPVVEMGVLMHHERIDGSGYPLKLTDERIHIYGKIIAIADVFDAMTSNRAYKGKSSPLDVLETMKEQSFGKLDAKCSATFINHMMDYYVGEFALLNNNTKAKILKMNFNYISRPLIAVGNNYIDLAETKDLCIVDII